MSQPRLYEVRVALVDLDGEDRRAIAAHCQIPFMDGLDDGWDQDLLEELVQREVIKALRQVQRTDREVRVGEE